MTSSADADIRKVEVDYLNDAYFTMLCATYVSTFMCGISAKHMTYDPDTPKQTTSLVRYHLYYHIRKFMRDPSRLTEHASGFLGPVKKYLPVAHIDLYPPGNDIVKATVNLSDCDYLSLIPYESGGLTELGQSLLQESIESLTYSVLGAQATTRWAIEGAGAKSTQTHIYDIFADTVAQKDPAMTIGNMRRAIADTNVRLDLAVSPGVILMPSNMIILEKGVAGLNNILTIADTDTMSFGKNAVNKRRKVGPKTDPEDDPKTDPEDYPKTNPEDDPKTDPEDDPKTTAVPNASIGSIVLLPTTVIIGILIARYLV